MNCTKLELLLTIEKKTNADGKQVYGMGINPAHPGEHRDWGCHTEGADLKAELEWIATTLKGVVRDESGGGLCIVQPGWGYEPGNAQGPRDWPPPYGPRIEPSHCIDAKTGLPE